MFAVRVASAVLFGFVGVVALMMAWRGLTANSLLPFHQAATGRTWTGLSSGAQSVATALTRSLGLGFLVAGLALLAASVTAVAHQDVATYSLAAIGLVFCAGLALINRGLHLATSTGNPVEGLPVRRGGDRRGGWSVQHRLSNKGAVGIVRSVPQKASTPVRASLSSTAVPI